MSEGEAGSDAAELQVLVQYRLIEALQEREHQLAEAQRLAHMGSWAWELASDTVTWSDELYRIFGRSPGDPVADRDSFFSMVRSDHRDAVLRVNEQALEEGGVCSYTCPIILDSGDERWIRVEATFERDFDGRPIRMHGVTQDVTAAHVAAEAIRDLSGLFEALVEHTSDILTIVNDDGTLRYSSPSANALLGHPRGSKRGAALFDLLHPDDIAIGEAALLALRTSPYDAVTLEVRLAHADGSWRIFESTGQNFLQDPALRGFLFTSRDVTEARELERRLEREILHDPLTGLPNRELLTALALASLARAARRGWTTALMIIDVDHFRAINDGHGFDAGDQLLVDLAARLERVFREEDGVARGGSVGRFAGDEFLVLWEQVDERTAARGFAERMAAVFGAPFRYGDARIPVTVSAGIALAPPGSSDFDLLLHEAESAVRLAKARGGDSCEIYDQELRRAEAARAESFRDLQLALERGELRLFFQPKVSLTTDRIVGAEGLLRWEHPARGLVPPLDFIPLAEETGLIIPIGQWVIEEACRQGARWQAMFVDRPPLMVCVNVSTRQFGPHLVDTVAAALESTGFPARFLTLELTESILMDDVEEAIAIVKDLKALGVSLAIDDFGTGYSSLSYLKQFHLHELKIDKSFVDGLGTDANDSAIVAAVIALAHALDLGVVAEGVETRDQVERLRSLGCEVGQGYLFARPAPAGALDRLLEDEATASWGAHANPAAAAGPAGTYRPERVLVVDDSEEVRQLTRFALAAVGFEVHDAPDGVAGVETARRLVPDCVLLDVMMPGLDGMAVCRALRADPATADCTILMLTANADAADKVRAFSEGADDYILKPFSPRDLVSRLELAMRRRRDAATSADVPPSG